MKAFIISSLLVSALSVATVSTINDNIEQLTRTVSNIIVQVEKEICYNIYM